LRSCGDSRKVSVNFHAITLVFIVHDKL
jgi:hypothetical protein